MARKVTAAAAGRARRLDEGAGCSGGIGTYRDMLLINKFCAYVAFAVGLVPDDRVRMEPLHRLESPSAVQLPVAART